MVSVIIPMYNPGKELSKMINSLLCQSYTNLEILLIDDGSTDETKQICMNIVNNDERFSYHYQINKGVSAARNYGMKKARGEYIAFLDADDTIDANYFDVLVKTCQNVDIAICNVSMEDCQGNSICLFTMQDQIITSDEAIDYLLMRKNINSGPCAKLFRRTIIQQFRFPDLRVYEDILFVLRAFSSAYKLGVTNKTTYHYYQNAQSAMHKIIDDLPLDIIVATDTIMAFIKQRNQINDQCVYTTLSHLYQYVQSYVAGSIIQNHFIKESRKLFRKYWRQILLNNAFTFKEKVIYSLFILGYIYKDKKIKKLRCSYE